MAVGYEWLHPMSEYTPTRWDKYIIWVLPVAYLLMNIAYWLIRKGVQ